MLLALSMPIDDLQFDALKKQFEMEDLSASPVTNGVLVSCPGNKRHIETTWAIAKGIENSRSLHSASLRSG
jgi:hypothetical protein